MELEIRENVPLAPLTTLGVGGAARFFARVRSSSEVEQAVAFSRNRQLPVFVLGGGSNLVVSDQGWNGLVLQVGIDGIHRETSHEKIVFDAGAGVNWDDVVAQSVSLNCSGMECLSGIPGSVGGTPVQNVGAYGQEVSQTIVSLLAYDLGENRLREIGAAECGFKYRRSIFNSSERERYIILRVKYSLSPNGGSPPKYDDLQKYFAGRTAAPTPAEVREAVRSIRASKGMLISAGEADSKSAGSFFKNPVLSREQFADLIRLAAARDLRIPSYPALSDRHKISAAWLVENSGFHKGYAKGRAAISSKHALAIVNRGGASAHEIVGICEEIRNRVYETWAVRLEPEPVFLGF